MVLIVEANEATEVKEYSILLSTIILKNKLSILLGNGKTPLIYK